MRSTTRSFRPVQFWNILNANSRGANFKTSKLKRVSLADKGKKEKIVF